MLPSVFFNSKSHFFCLNQLICEFMCFYWLHVLIRWSSMKKLRGISFCGFLLGFLVFCTLHFPTPVVWFSSCHGGFFFLSLFLLFFCFANAQGTSFVLFALIECEWLLKSLPLILEIILFVSVSLWGLREWVDPGREAPWAVRWQF